MKEFGSDFHYLPCQDSPSRTLMDYYPNATYYAVGRHALMDLFAQSAWKRLWVPEYFCHDVLASLQRSGVALKLYQDSPLNDERKTLQTLPYEEGDALLRVNYFGLRTKRSCDGIPVPVIEDHTHDLIGDWATNSIADWCIASLRKTLPLAEGGILWSPKGLRLRAYPDLTSENELLASMRWRAMRKKTLYLNDLVDNKNEFRSDLISTEEKIDVLSISAMDDESLSYIRQFDIDQWYRRKRENRERLKEISFDCATVLEPENAACNPFSLTLLFDSETQRNQYRSYLINHSIYPAILWVIPRTDDTELSSFSSRMLSVHCDARYNREEMMQLRHIIAKGLSML